MLKRRAAENLSCMSKFLPATNIRFQWHRSPFNNARVERSLQMMHTFKIASDLSLMYVWRRATTKFTKWAAIIAQNNRLSVNAPFSSSSLEELLIVRVVHLNSSWSRHYHECPPLSWIELTDYVVCFIVTLQHFGVLSVCRPVALQTWPLYTFETT